MNTVEYKQKLVEQFNKTVTNLEQLRGAIAACDELIKSEDDTTHDESND